MPQAEPNVDRLLEGTLHVSRWSRARRRVRTLETVSVLIGTLLVLLVAGCVASGRGGATGRSDSRVGSSTCSGQGGCVDLPPVTASPETVVRTFLAAIDHHDTGLAKALLEPGFRAQMESTEDSWLTNVRSITEVAVLGTIANRDSSRKLLSEGFREVTIVSAFFVLDQQKVWSINDGDTSKDFTLVRRGSGSRWLIEEIGTD